MVVWLSPGARVLMPKVDLVFFFLMSTSMKILDTVLMLFWSQVLDLQQVFLCFQYSFTVSSDIHWQMTTLTLEMLHFTSPSLSPLSPFISLLPMLQTFLPCAATSGRHILHPLQDMPGAGVPLTSPLLLRRLRKEFSGLQLPGGDREGKGSRCLSH